MADPDAHTLGYFTLFTTRKIISRHHGPRSLPLFHTRLAETRFYTPEHPSTLHPCTHVSALDTLPDSYMLSDTAYPLQPDPHAATQVVHTSASSLKPNAPLTAHSRRAAAFLVRLLHHVLEDRPRRWCRAACGGWPSRPSSDAGSAGAGCP